ncbi:hypothetical protein [Xanthovirga aplysinae]|uniref:hypothetical protein n=1 Tax=Xanthovirga aplysinae TaxID=2529853 RepID=UPI0012BD06B6|nr:hypothetical protein [Xanthovirga aplysinae]
MEYFKKLSIYDESEDIKYSRNTELIEGYIYDSYQEQIDSTHNISCGGLDKLDCCCED